MPVAVLLSAPELLNTPLNWLAAQAEIGNGKIKVSRFTVESDLFAADTRGEIPIAEVLPKSPLKDFPVHFSLARSVADKIRLAKSESSISEKYVRLPDFLKASGTLEHPKSKIDKAVLAGSVLDAVSKLPGVNKKTAELLQGVGNLFSKPKPADTKNSGKAEPAQPAANPPPPINPLDLLKKPKKN